jgi:hypothetical protein
MRSIWSECWRLPYRPVQEAPRQRRAPLEGLAHSRETMVGRVRQVMKQTRIRIFAGDTKSPEKIVGVFEPHAEIIRKGKASKPNEFGKLVKIQEAENQIVTHFEVYTERPADSTLLLSAIEVHQQRLGRIPRMVAADAGFYSRANEKAGQALGVRWMSVPNKNTTSKKRKLLQHQRWFHRGQKWRPVRRAESVCSNEDTGCDRWLYPGLEGMRRWVGLDGVLSCATEHLGRYSQLVSRSRMDERKNHHPRNHGRISNSPATGTGTTMVMESWRYSLLVQTRSRKKRVNAGAIVDRCRSMNSSCVEDQFHKVAKLSFCEYRMIR